MKTVDLIGVSAAVPLEGSALKLDFFNTSPIRLIPGLEIGNYEFLRYISAILPTSSYLVKAMQKINLLKATSSVGAGVVACSMVSFMDISLVESAMAGDGPTVIIFSLPAPQNLSNTNTTPAESPALAPTETTVTNSVQPQSAPTNTFSQPLSPTTTGSSDFRNQLQQGIGR